MIYFKDAVGQNGISSRARQSNTLALSETAWADLLPEPLLVLNLLSN